MAMIKAWMKRQNRLIKRRGGIREHYRLSKVFYEIRLDPYVLATREQAARDNSYPRLKK